MNFKIYCSKISQPITLLEACSSQIPLVNYLKVLGLTCRQRDTHTKKKNHTWTDFFTFLLKPYEQEVYQTNGLEKKQCKTLG